MDKNLINESGRTDDDFRRDADEKLRMELFPELQSPPSVQIQVGDQILNPVIENLAPEPTEPYRVGSSLATLDTSQAPEQVLNVLALKSSAISQALLDSYDIEKLGSLLAALVERYQGTTFTDEEFHSLAAEHGMDLRDLLGDWLYETGLPGFLISDVETLRLKDTKTGQPQYQTTLHVRNGERTPGMFAIEYMWGFSRREEDVTQDNTQPIRLKGNEAVEIGIVSGSPLWDAKFHPYLALNRGVVSLLGRDHFAQYKKLGVDNFKNVVTEPFNGVRPSAWHPDQDVSPGTLVVDDLDNTFQFHSSNEVPSCLLYTSPSPRD